MITQDRLKQVLFYNPETGEWTWLAGHRKGKVAGRTKKNGYRHIKVDQKDYLAHRLAFFYMNGYWPEIILDHKDRNKANNVWENIREANYTQNNINRRPLNRKIHDLPAGVYKEKKGGRYTARYQPKTGFVYLGTYDTPEEASQVYKEYLKTLHGEFAWLE